jgi:hypothetical protein
MYKYRNSILKHNPRSYLEHEGQTVNNEIRNSIVERRTNEFALFNNGITLLSDGTFLNERIGQKDRAQLRVMELGSGLVLTSIVGEASPVWNRRDYESAGTR